MAEQRFCKAKVGGSTPLPGSGLICSSDFVICDLVKWVRRIAAIARGCKPRVLTGYAGSSPAAPTNPKTVPIAIKFRF